MKISMTEILNQMTSDDSAIVDVIDVTALSMISQDQNSANYMFELEHRTKSKFHPKRIVQQVSENIHDQSDNFAGIY